MARESNNITLQRIIKEMQKRQILADIIPAPQKAVRCVRPLRFNIQVFSTPTSTNHQGVGINLENLVEKELSSDSFFSNKMLTVLLSPSILCYSARVKSAICNLTVVNQWQ